MRTKEEIKREISQLKAQLEPLEKELSKVYSDEADVVKKRIKLCEVLKDKFTEDELVFAAFARCDCGAGLAYPKNIGIHGAWYCSDILLGLAVPSKQPEAKTHVNCYPFNFYDIKSDQQPSANGATTRRKKEDNV